MHSTIESVGYDGGGITFSPDGQVLNMGYGTQVARWDIAAGALSNLVGRQDPLRATDPTRHDIHPVQSEDGTRFAILMDGLITVWDLLEGTPLQTFQPGPNSSSILYLHSNWDGKLLATQTDRRVFVWEVESGELLAEFEHQGLYAQGVAFAPDGQRIAIGWWDTCCQTQVIVYDLDTRVPDLQFTVSSVLNQIVWSEKGRWLAVDPGNRLLVYHGRSPVRQCDFSYFESSETWGNDHLPIYRMIPDMAFSPDGTLLAVIGRQDGSWEYEIVIWDVGTCAQVATQKTSYVRPDALAFSPDGAMLAIVGLSPASISLWNVEY